MPDYPNLFDADGRSYALGVQSGRDVGLYTRLGSGVYVPLRAPASMVTTTRFGACLPQYAPGSSSAGSGTEQNVIDKFGPTKVFLRRFAGIPTTTPPTKTVGASGNHYSCSFGIVVRGTWTQALRDSNDAMADAIVAHTYDSQIDATFGPLDPTYWRAEVLHEADTKTNGSQPFLDLAKAQKLKEYAYNRIKAVNSTLPVLNTFQAYAFSDTSPRWQDGTFQSRWGSVPCDRLGADFDGIAPPKDGSGNYVLPYPALAGNRDQNIMQWVLDKGLAGWDVPEVGTYANAVAADADNIVLAQWMTDLFNRWLALAISPGFVTWYDYGPNPEADASTYSDVLAQPASINALKGFVSRSVTSYF